MLPYSPQSDTSQPTAPGARPGPALPTKPAPQEIRPRRSRLPLIIASILVIIILLGAAFAYYYFFLKASAPTVGIGITAPDSVLLGQPFDVSASYANTSDQVLKNASLILNLPAGVSLIGASSDKRFSEEEIGDIAPGYFGNAVFHLIATADSQTVKHFDLKLRYGLQNDPTRTASESKTADIAVGASVVDVNFATPQSVVSGQNFSAKLVFRNNSQTALQNLKIAMAYPAELNIEQSTTTADIVPTGKSSWLLERLEPNASGTITLVANTNGNNPTLVITSGIGIETGGQSYVVWTQKTPISVSQAPLALSILANNQADHVATIGETVQYHVLYKNNAAVPLQNVVIRLKATSPLFDYANLRATGAQFDSTTRTITWNSVGTPQLASVEPGGGGEVVVAIPLIQKFNIQRISDRNFVLRAQGVIESPTVPPGVEASKTISAASLETKLAGDIALLTPAYYYEPSASLKNSGPYPLRVGKETTFTIHWQLRNGTNDMERIHVSAMLASGVRFIGVLKSSAESQPVHNAGSGEITWDIPKLNATQGTIGGNFEAIFQVAVTPAINQLNQPVPLIGDATLTATDAFTGLAARAEARGTDSNIPNDPRGAGNGRVLQ